jgi:hypothetical protein
MKILYIKNIITLYKLQNENLPINVVSVKLYFSQILFTNDQKSKHDVKKTT